MEFDKLRTIQIEERKKSSLQKINEDFYEEIQPILHPTIGDDMVGKDIHLARSMRICIDNIIMLRFQKIVKVATKSAMSGNTPMIVQHMTPEEKELFNQINTSTSIFMERVYESE